MNSNFIHSMGIEKTSNNRFKRITLLSRFCAVASLGKNRANDALPLKRMLCGDADYVRNRKSLIHQGVS